ncbi:hypothetical protein IF1G_03659 [Cordyceps javanica]|uniref:Uncharacterized protein n=1 Tax=Cordyceps javanica TaxID=43265 RepID=A0A545W4M5_9HYPO|nr:hypothetical protein IF1G_03659 [Cordyceps javanica]TQW08900.1 hypothetical protein IF2G_03331 [Cordyceps javanica]
MIGRLLMRTQIKLATQSVSGVLPFPASAQHAKQCYLVPFHLQVSKVKNKKNKMIDCAWALLHRFALFTAVPYCPRQSGRTSSLAVKVTAETRAHTMQSDQHLMFLPVFHHKVFFSVPACSNMMQSQLCSNSFLTVDRITWVTGSSPNGLRRHLVQREIAGCSGEPRSRLHRHFRTPPVASN